VKVVSSGGAAAKSEALISKSETNFNLPKEENSKQRDWENFSDRIDKIF